MNLETPFQSGYKCMKDLILYSAVSFCSPFCTYNILSLQGNTFVSFNLVDLNSKLHIRGGSFTGPVSGSEGLDKANYLVASKL